MSDPSSFGPECPTQLVYEQQQQQPILVSRSAVVRVVAGLNVGASCQMLRERVGVGTAPDNSLALSDPQVSRHHLEFQVRDRGYLLLDLGSTNGTFYRGARVREAEVGIGAEVRLGSTVLRLEQGPVHSEGVAAQEGFGGLLGSSPRMQKVFGLLAAVAPTDTTVLIEGETGTGKELVAEEIHRQSPRRHHSFLVIDCGSLPPTLIESELFGHERGAYTGALTTREGAFERARGGTVFLDELGELPLELQTRLLRVLDKREVKRVGSNISRGVDVRLVAATNRDLAEEVQRGNFRQDLYYRLAVVRIMLPPLRKRREDIPLLARQFLWQGGCVDPEAVLTPEVLATLATRKWPGNVRELRNVVERAVVMSDGPGAQRAFAESEPDTTTQENVEAEGEPPPDWLGRALPAAYLERPFKEVKKLLLEALEDVYLGRLFERHGTNISRMAQEAGVDRHLVRNYLRRRGLHEPQEEP